MPFINWDENLSVGIEEFDADHRKLIGYINELHMGLVSKAQASAMKTVLDGLIEYTKVHFKKEEDLMEIHNYLDLAEHREKHRRLVEQVLDYKEQFDEGKGSFSLELMSFLRDWLVKHIQGTDKLYGSFFNGKGIK